MSIEKLAKEMREAAEALEKPPEVMPTVGLDYNQRLHYRVMSQPANVLRILDALQRYRKALIRIAEDPKFYIYAPEILKALEEE